MLIVLVILQQHDFLKSDALNCHKKCFRDVVLLFFVKFVSNVTRISMCLTMMSSAIHQLMYLFRSVRCDYFGPLGHISFTRLYSYLLDFFDCEKFER
jgi:hypothetical protein